MHVLDVGVLMGFERNCFVSANGDQLEVAPERGGLLTRWVCGGRERLYLDAARFADPVKSVRGGIPVLFPICGNLPNDTLALPQGDFHLPQHGFARDMPWDLEALNDGQGIRLLLQDSASTLAVFPFPFRLTLEYRLKFMALSITAIVEHRSNGSGLMPFSLGLHPYFAVSGLEVVTVEGLPEICLDHHQMAESSTEKQLSQLANGVDLLALPSQHVVRLIDRGTTEVIQMNLQPPMDLAVVWTDPPRKMVCLEPWTAPRGALLSGERRLELKPGEKRQFHCSYQVVHA